MGSPREAGLPRVRLLGGLERILGGRNLTLAAEGVKELIEKLAEKGGQQAACLLYRNPGTAEPELHEDLRILVNGRDIEFLGRLDTKVSEEDTVTLYLHGGRGYPGG